MKTAVIYNPYWDTLGGGEKYVASVINAYQKAKYQPIILWHDKSLLSQISRRFGLDLSGAAVDLSLLSTLSHANIRNRLKLTSQFDSFFWVSDGSIPLLGSKNNLLHFQVPFNNKQSLFNRLKLKNFDHIICNSHFTKSVIDKNYGCHSAVLYPPVTLMPQAQKDKTILSVGRFDNILHSKRQDVLISVFKALPQSGWKLVLAGGSIDTSGKVKSLQKFIGDYPIEIIVNPSFKQIQELYSKASIYWHAAGFGSNLKKSPEKAEHFGITTVEAMSAGAIPVVYAGGGQLEIVKEGENGFLWHTETELINKTNQIIRSKINMTNLTTNAINTAKEFSQDRFVHEFQKYIH